MERIAIKMLVGDRAKYLSLVFGLAFAVLLIAQQGSIFLGLMLRSTGFLQNIAQPDLWISDPHIRYIADVRPLNDHDLYRVRSIPGIAWAVPFFAARTMVDLPDGTYKSVQLIGIDRSTLIGQPPDMTEGRLEDLRLVDAVLVEESARPKLGHVKVGDILKLNDKRAKIVGFCRAKLGFESNAIIYTTYDNAVRFTPTGRKRMTFILAKAKPGEDPQLIAAAVNRLPDLGAFTLEEIRWRTVQFILIETGIGINFGITVLLGFIVGLVVSAATFYQFTLENLRHFAVLKAIGARTSMLVKMILLQALVVGLIGYGIGVGLAGAFSLIGRKPGAELAVFFPWQLMVVSLVAMILTVSVGSLLSLRRVITLEPAVVFK
ncbi:MAG: ABC transporter permease [Planctomycetota bacterium]|nr:ABC transporter permease [Planctomycetota bacterium]